MYSYINNYYYNTFRSIPSVLLERFHKQSSMDHDEEVQYKISLSTDRQSIYKTVLSTMKNFLLSGYLRQPYLEIQDYQSFLLPSGFYNKIIKCMAISIIKKEHQRDYQITWGIGCFIYYLLTN